MRRRRGSYGWLRVCALALVSTFATSASNGICQERYAPGSNPIIRDEFLADPAPLVVGDTLYLYVDHDEAKDGEMFNMREWLVYSTTDMKTWKAYPPILNIADLKWAKKDAWAPQAIRRMAGFYLYVPAEHDDTHPGKAIAWRCRTARRDRSRCRGSALITNEMTPKGEHSWEDIDPTVLTDRDGTSWIAWGNRSATSPSSSPT